MPEFRKVARKSELPAGGGKCVEVNGKSIALFKVGEKVYAIDNTCLHRGGPLGEGSLDGSTVTCPWHGWQFNVTSGEKCGDAAVRVRSYPVELKGEDVLVML